LRRAKQKGAALLTVLIAMMIITIMLFEFQYSAMVERKLAYNELNQLQALHLAKAGARIGLLRVALFARLRRSPALKNVGGGIDVTPYLEQVWKLPLPPFPPTQGTVQKLNTQDKNAAEKVMEQTKVEDGQYTHVITSESNKINLNFLQVPANLRSERITFSDSPKSLFEYVGKTLVNLLENFIRDSEDPYQEFPNLKPDELVFNLMDWVNPGSFSFAGGAKDSFYEQQKPPYKAKRGRFFTIEELKLVKGIDDHMYEKLKPLVTVYSYDGKININTASSNVLRALYKDFTEDDMKRLMEERDRIGGWMSEKAFVEFVTSTLGRQGFKTYFSNEADYPFTIASQSFVIESAGILKRSKSVIMKTMRIGVALTVGKGGTTDSSYTSAAACNAAPGRAWNPLLASGAGACVTAPTTDAECLNLGGGAFTVIDGKKCCLVPNTFRYCLDNTSTPTAGAAGGNPATPAKAVDPNTMKILFWSEG